MEEQEQVKKIILKHVIYNIIGFTTIFLIFGIFIFIMVRSITYKNVNTSLNESRKQILNLDEDKITLILEKPLFFDLDIRDDWIQNTVREYSNEIISRRVVNPNIIVIIRNSNFEIQNINELGRLTEYVNEIDFNEKNVDRIYEIPLGNKYYYHCMNFLYKGNTETKYIQLLINVDSERTLVNHYFYIISISIFIGIILSIIASYILSIKTLKPLNDNVLKQMEFVQNVSHELRTPLTIIQAKQELLLQEPDKKIMEKSEDIGLTLSETKRLTKLVKDLMILSRADTNKIELQKESVNIDEFIKNLITPYIEIAELEEKSITLNLNYNQDIEIDTNKIHQLMIILLDNAIKYTRSGDSIEIRTNLKDNKCVIEIADTGIGVSDDGLKRIFERFYRENKDRNRETGGSGLGLSIASYIVSAHNGTIKATHNTPNGTIFTIRLPK